MMAPESAGVTVAVKSTDWFTDEEVGDETTAVVVGVVVTT
jgi:hypothetical protein